MGVSIEIMNRKMNTENDMSMDEILSSIRTLIAEDKDVYSQSSFAKSVEDNTNPAGARRLSDIPVFDDTDTFSEGSPAAKKPISGISDLPSSSTSPLEQVVFEPVVEKSSLEKQRQFSENAWSASEKTVIDRDPFSAPPQTGIAENRIQEDHSNIRNIVQSHSADPMSFIPDNPAWEESTTNGLDNLIEKLVLQRVEGILEKKIDTIVEKIIAQKLEALLSKV